MHFPCSTRRARGAWLVAPLAGLGLLASCADGYSFSFDGGDRPEGGATIVVTGSVIQAQIDLGHKLFFDERLSIPIGIACGTCHDPFLGWGDQRPQGKGVQNNTVAGPLVQGNYYKTVLTARNTPTIYNAHVFPNLFWDGRAGDLAHQAQFPFEATIEMNSSWKDHILPFLKSDPVYRQMFKAAYEDDRITRDRAIEAMGAFESTISVFDTPYDQYVAGNLTALTAEEIEGHDLFFGAAGCAGCHPAPLLTDMSFRNTGVPSAGTHALNGTVDLGFGVRTDLTVTPPVVHDDPQDYAKFKVPQLRMLGVTGPYMHNGAFATLEEVVDFYDQGGGPDLSGTGTKDPAIVPLGLTQSQKDALVAFLRDGLTGDEIK